MNSTAPPSPKRPAYSPWLTGLVLVVWLAVLISLTMAVLRGIALPDFGSIQGRVWSLMSFSAALGALAMVLVQITRQLVPFRGEFHLAELKRLMGTDPPAGIDQEEIGKALEQLAGRPPSDDDFDMPLEQLCGQLAAAAERVVADPSAKSALARCLAGKDGEADLKKATTADSPAVSSDDAGKAELDRLAAQQALLRIMLARIDRFQLDAGTRWRRRLRATVLQVSLFFGVVIAFAGAWQADSTTSRLGFVLYGALAGLMAAFFAMLFRDLTAMAERRRP